MYYDGTDLSGHYITFAKPIYDHAGNLVCVCGADMTIDWLRVELADIDNANKRNPLLKGAKGTGTFAPCLGLLKTL